MTSKVHIIQEHLHNDGFAINSADNEIRPKALINESGNTKISVNDDETFELQIDNSDVLTGDSSGVTVHKQFLAPEDSFVTESSKIGINGVTTVDSSIDNLQLELNSLQQQITSNRQAQSIARGSFDTFNDSFVIDDTNAAVNGGRVNIYAAKIDKIVNVTIPTTAQLATAGLSYPYGLEFVHSAGSSRILTNNILRIDAGSSSSGDLIEQPILQNPAVAGTRVQMFQGDIGLFVKDDAVSNYRYLQGAFDPIAEITRQGIFAFRNDHVITDIDDISTILNNVTINQGDAFLVQSGGTRFGYNIGNGDVILAKINNPSLASNSDDWLHFADSSQALTSDQMAFFGNIQRTGNRFDLSRNVLVDESNVDTINNVATGTALNSGYPYFTTGGGATARTATFTNQNIQFSDLIGGKLNAVVNFQISNQQGFAPELTELILDYGSGISFTFPLTNIAPDAGSVMLSIDISNQDYSAILNSNCTVTLNYEFRGASIIALFTITSLFNLRTGTLNNSVTSIAQQQASLIETRLKDRLSRLEGELNTAEDNVGDVAARIPYRNITVTTPDHTIRWLDSTGSDSAPTDVGTMNEVSADNPRFEAGNVALYIAAIGGNEYVLKNITQSTVLALDEFEATVSVIASRSFNSQVYFLYQVTGITATDVFEIDRSSLERVVGLRRDVDVLENRVDGIEAELEHAALNLPNEVVHVLENETEVIEESNPTIVASDYNRSLTGTANTQAVFYEGNSPAPSGGFQTSQAINANSGNDKYRNKLLYIPSGSSYGNSTIVHAFDNVSTSTDLISYQNGVFNAKVFVPAKNAGSSTETIYPAPATRVSGAGIWQTIEALTTRNGIPVAEADELFFTRNIPNSGTTLNIQYRGHANGNIFGAGSTTLANVGGSTLQSTSFVLNDGSESATVEVTYFPSFQGSGHEIRVTVTERVNNGLPTINDIQVILSYSETRTIPATPATTRDVEIERGVPTNYQVFAFKPDSSGNLIIVGSEREINTNYAYTDLFGATEVGHLSVSFEDATFLDYEDIDIIDTTVRELQDHALLPQLGLFTTQYDHETILALDTAVEANGVVIYGSLTSTQRDALPTSKPAIIYNSTNQRFEFLEDGVWEAKSNI